MRTLLYFRRWRKRWCWRWRRTQLGCIYIEWTRKKWKITDIRGQFSIPLLWVYTTCRGWVWHIGRDFAGIAFFTWTDCGTSCFLCFCCVWNYQRQRLTKQLLLLFVFGIFTLRVRLQGIHPGFETQGKRHQKSKTGVSVVPKKGLYVLETFIKRSSVAMTNLLKFSLTLF